MAGPADHADAGLYLHAGSHHYKKYKLAFTLMQVCAYAQIAQKNFASCRLREKKFCKFAFTQKYGRITRLTIVTGR